MEVYTDIYKFRKVIKQLKYQNRSIALVPTMGNIHRAHFELIRNGRKHADIVIVSIFVNPMQFERTDDFKNYPRTLEDDLKKLNSEKVNLVFTPTLHTIYPSGIDKHTFVKVPGISDILEGALRPGHFLGVTTVVNKLFNIVQPDIACFGQKDFQQLAIIQKMTTDLSMDIRIISIPTVREANGLAISSRNCLLTETQTQCAPVLANTMRWIATLIRNGRNDYHSIIKNANTKLQANGLKPTEIFICDATTFQTITKQTTKAVILMSAFLGRIRLIDNQIVNLLN
ncbi:pantothenate synthetase [Candidatus Photodesmus katoptron]|uniref:Pantothenate synthetase n=1 Tax=Candidatus Photodesmus katoptron Akat1 TaxID=1236703 RepID=S3DZR0_9GAMM|nr:pantoate--beta-alanine ligase [Candidatus Photodesmus katoptron]EPE37446.1 pantoate--beta-alanine ligase [Candidatus Photodesmus katoptron Akat1]KEY90216.1 pantothenate synthetase [Candidatus Photodesmus katoptron]